MRFDGFEHLTANYLYCPNQFFEVCLPHHSRGTVRLVAYLLRKTLGWLDTEGSPIEQDISVSYRDLINEAGISRGAIRKALDEAVAGGFIICIQQGKANGNNQSSETACYALRWDTDTQYHKNFEKFNGFFAGEGYRTPIPNSFFDLIVKHEALSVVKVVGTVLRHTVGYQNQFGGRRQIAPLSYSYIQKYVNLSDRSTLSAAIQHAIETGYVHCVQKGGIDPSHIKRRPSTYAIRWHEQANGEVNGSKTRLKKSHKKITLTNNKPIYLLLLLLLLKIWIRFSYCNTQDLTRILHWNCQGVGDWMRSNNRLNGYPIETQIAIHSACYDEPLKEIG
ncbi:hypothetical protein Pan241w_18130 [Gimesia alba]|uniref:Bacteriophage lambda Replication protein O N-terminal domain-containing protein n=1 Tax=Gimesia alba TaxID=2527973 RepID=A0A517RCZ0_9PLAN|nr:hypothetical protein [Gimesia alba]QDT41750.1 hypothetical protein Pan241w_18130 [Gimesia alba]